MPLPNPTMADVKDNEAAAVDLVILVIVAGRALTEWVYTAAGTSSWLMWPSAWWVWW